MIEQLVSQVAAKLGIDESTAQQAVGSILGLLQKQGDDSAVAALFDQIPGAASLAGQFQNAGSSSGGLMGMVGGLMGGRTANAMEAMNALKQSGLSMDQAKEMAPVMTDFMKENASEELLHNAVQSVPGLKDLLG
jgi:hypothetical protein